MEFKRKAPGQDGTSGAAWRKGRGVGVGGTSLRTSNNLRQCLEEETGGRHQLEASHREGQPALMGSRVRGQSPEEEKDSISLQG